ncbi:hypothetical protein [Puniceibacterium sediminis]|uniref:Uncharacterized protein n=1 Tax=Puniceibacterium sediminis TaxID=1608407 RepID=A0A238YPM1_9RHOB|nr:hypothetical protein [Puniceibacterium sediminis]SNR72543.1 hypothetical protein SAMN06265370_11860 [Puniceibacterium sediminis]
MMDAGVVYVEKVLDLKPDICILDWATSALQDCDPRMVQQIYHRLMEHEILPVTLLFPPRDRVQKDIPIARKMARIADILTRPEATPRAPPALHCADCRADGGHAGQLQENHRQHPELSRRRGAALFPTGTPCRRLFVAAGSGLHIHRRKRPHTFAVFDPWWHRQWQCIKGIMDCKVARNLSRVEFSTSQTVPSLHAAVTVNNPISAADRHIRPHGQLYVLAAPHGLHRALCLDLQEGLY